MWSELGNLMVSSGTGVTAWKYLLPCLRVRGALTFQKDTVGYCVLTLRAETAPSAETFQFIHLGPVETTSTENQLPSLEKKNPILRMGIDNLFGPALFK